MKTVVEVGSEILTNTPSNFYVFLGSDYGIKQEYVDKLSDFYNGNVILNDSMEAVISLMKSKHIIPLQPALYLVRYDKEFISSLSNAIQSEMKQLKILGTIVCIYEDPSDSNKLIKYLPDFCVELNPMEPKYIKYNLQKQYNLDESIFDIATKLGENFGKSKLLCESLSFIDKGLSFKDCEFIFGYSKSITDLEIKKNIAARQYTKLFQLVEIYLDKPTIFYLFLSTMLELEKIKLNQYYQSELRQFSNLWTMEDIYNLFNISYKYLCESRKLSTNIDNMICLLIGLLGFKSIPNMEWVEF